MLLKVKKIWKVEQMSGVGVATYDIIAETPTEAVKKLKESRDTFDESKVIAVRLYMKVEE